MCGIFCALNVNHSFSKNEYDSFVKSTQIVSYRGPDAFGHLLLNLSNNQTSEDSFNIFLGHQRLSIIDLSTLANQPFSEGDYHIVFNGEIFNYIELRKELIKKGYHFKTDSDTEVILKIYQEYGEPGFNKFNGMWAFCLVDLKKRKMVLSRDRFSIKPLYFAQPSEGFYIFASEIKQILPFISQKKLNASNLFLFLQQSLLDTNEGTLVEGISKIKPKFNTSIDLETGEVKESKYWDYSSANASSASNPEEHFHELLTDSIQVRLRSDVEVGALLSGGLDSSSIAVLSNNLCHGGFKTFSVVSEDKKYSEEYFIDLLSQRCKISNTKLTFNTNQIIDSIDKVLYHQDEPFAGLSVVAQYHIFEKIKSETSIKVVLSGQGGDEILMGYLKYYFFNLSDKLKSGKLISFSRELLGALLNRTIIQQFRLKEAKRYIPWMAKDTLSFLNIKSNTTDTWSYSSLNQRQCLDIDHFSVPVLAHYEDRNSMAHSIESRLPFLDHRLVEFMIQLPVDLKLKNGWSKYILRKSIKELPDEIRWRRDKQGFVTPEEIWLKTSLQPMVKEEFTKYSVLGDMGVLNPALFMKEYDKFVNDKSNMHALDFFRIFIAERWAKKLLN